MFAIFIFLAFNSLFILISMLMHVSILIIIESMCIFILLTLINYKTDLDESFIQMMINALICNIIIACGILLLSHWTHLCIIACSSPLFILTIVTSSFLLQHRKDN